MSTSDGIVREFWQHPWGRTLLVAATVAMVSWAVRETAVITFPVFQAMSSVIIPLALGFTLAYVLTPAVDKLQSRGLTRMMATSILFVLLLLASLLILSLVVPAIVSQTTDMVKRSVEESYFYDKNGDGVYSPGEALIRPATDKEGNIFYFHDTNNNAHHDIGEGRFDQSHFATLSAPEGIVKEPSFIQKATALIDGYQADLESMVGVEPDDRTLAFVIYYLDKTREIRELIRDGLVVDAGNKSWNTWIRKVKLPKEIDPELTWKRNWPGAMWDELQKTRDNLPESHLQQWNVAMAYLGQQFATEHQRLLSQWDKIRGGQGVGAGSNGLLDALEADIEEGKREESLKFINSLRSKQDVTSRDLLIAISGPSSGDSQGVMQEMVLSMNTVLQQQFAQLPDHAAGWAYDLLRNIDAVLMFSLNVFLIPVYAFFLCLGMPTIRATLKAYIPIKGHDRTLRIVQRIERAVAAFFRGRLIVCIICAILTWIGFAILGIPYAALFGLLIGLATAIPMAGLVFLVPAILLTLIEGGDNIALRASLAIVVYGIVQALEATVFTPTIMGKEVELHPVLLIVALLLCGSLLGVFGLILAVPIAATARIFAREFFLPKIREAAGVPDTMMIRRTETVDDNEILTSDVMNPSYKISPDLKKESETDVDGDDLTDFEGEH